ncbi:IS3 family transposase [Amycolatopsis sp. NPDC051758]|uniref:IS3 family transposase n=1 Tax=Amycolatopsis sp. NPDC051758 TaxID=3363935 RepID=UPI00379B030B
MIYRYRFISEHRTEFGVKRLCQVLGLRRQGFHEWIAAEADRARRAEAEAELVTLIASIHAEHRGAYSVPRITAELHRRGHIVNHKRVERLMREHGLAGITRRKRRTLTRPAAGPVTPVGDLIRRNFTAEKPGTRLVGDITCLPTFQGWLYLATVIDLHTREIIGHAMASHMRTDLVCDAIDLATARGLIDDDAVFHSDRGVQGEFNRSSQHLDRGGVRWAATRSWSGCPKGRGGSGRRTGRCGRRCGRRAGLSPRAVCSGSSGA